MSFTQRFFTAILPKRWAEDMRAESLAWMMRCPCGFERSVWEMGGIRWKARGNPKRLITCPKCGQRTWHSVYRSTQTPP
ncbi:MAG: hypothetical protein KF851_19200 [Pirellulaceae bacterium]|nr:hypothetical protein [Pirellulaceae bacterium]